MINVSISRIRAASRCPTAFAIEYGLGKSPLTRSEAMEMGKDIHKLLAALHMSKPLPTCFDNTIVDTLQAYLKEYGPEVNMGHAPLAAEFGVAVPVRTPAGTRSNYRFVGVIDLVTYLNGEIWIWDHKSGKTMPDITSPSIGYQVACYAWALHAMGAPVGGVVINCIRVSKNPAFRRLERRVLPSEFAQWEKFIYTQARAFPNTNRPWHEQPRALTLSCNWDCPYSLVCSLALEGRVEDANYLLSDSTEYGPKELPKDVTFHTEIPRAWWRRLNADSKGK